MTRVTDVDVRETAPRWRERGTAAEPLYPGEAVIPSDLTAPPYPAVAAAKGLVALLAPPSDPIAIASAECHAATVAWLRIRADLAAMEEKKRELHEAETAAVSAMLEAGRRREDLIAKARGQVTEGEQPKRKRPLSEAQLAARRANGIKGREARARLAEAKRASQAAGPEPA